MKTFELILRVKIASKIDNEEWTGQIVIKLPSVES